MAVNFGGRDSAERTDLIWHKSALGATISAHPGILKMAELGLTTYGESVNTVGSLLTFSTANRIKFASLIYKVLSRSLSTHRLTSGYEEGRIIIIRNLKLRPIPPTKTASKRGEVQLRSRSPKICTSTDSNLSVSPAFNFTLAGRQPC